MGSAVTARGVRLSGATGVLREQAVETRTYGIRGACALVVLAASITFTSGCGVLDWLGKHPPPNNPPPPPRPKSTVTFQPGAHRRGPARSAARRSAAPRRAASSLPPRSIAVNGVNGIVQAPLRARSNAVMNAAAEAGRSIVRVASARSKNRWTAGVRAAVFCAGSPCRAAGMCRDPCNANA